MAIKKFVLLLVVASTISASMAFSQNNHTIARKWNEVILAGIRNDFARPTIHARNLFHISAAMYDAWAVITLQAQPYFLGKTVNGYTIQFSGFPLGSNPPEAAAEEAISYAVYRLMAHRYRNSPDYQATKALMDSLMRTLDYPVNNFNTNYLSGSPAALGNYLAEQIINFGLQDGANEIGNYENLVYEPVNPPLPLLTGGSNHLNYPNNWQPLEFDEPFIDQSGNVVSSGAIPFLSPEWGNVAPFALTDADRVTRQARGVNYNIYKDPGAPPWLDTLQQPGHTDPYKWGFSMVSVWQSHLDPADTTRIDISPASMGNISLDSLPATFADYDQFYNFFEGGDTGKGYAVNPKTGQPYQQQMVRRGDYGRILAEFWADGPDSETPPGHWFVILNYVMDQPGFQRRFAGSGQPLPPLEWDVKAYFTLGGAMHDAAVAAWSVKGFYDYIRPVSAIRYMATQGQSSNPAQPRYSPKGMPLVNGYIELVKAGDPLAGANGEHLNKIKLYTWRGHDFVQNTETDHAGVGWILAENWWPYQRPSFVTPPFAGYVSGHSTFSRAAAEVLTLVTGDPYFPGGAGEFVATKNEYLVFEEGPSETVVLQWAKYYDASDQCSLSRIWGGIHPPADDLPGRKMGSAIGKKAFAFASQLFSLPPLALPPTATAAQLLYPNPATTTVFLTANKQQAQQLRLFHLNGTAVPANRYAVSKAGELWQVDVARLVPGLYLLTTGKGHWYRIIKK